MYGTLVPQFQDVPRKQQEEDQLRKEQEVPFVNVACGPDVCVCMLCYVMLCYVM